MPWSTIGAYLDAHRPGSAIMDLFTGCQTASTSTTRWDSLWVRGNTEWPNGTRPAAGLGSAVALNRSSTGALVIPSTAVGLVLAQWELLRSASTLGVILLIDRLAHATITHAQATGAFAPAIDATARLASGEGAMIMVEVGATALSAASNTFSFGYTNQAGTAGRTTATAASVASAGSTSNVLAGPQVFVPLQAGDDGVRSIENWTLVSGAATGDLLISLVKPVAALMLGPVRETVNKRDFVVSAPNMPRIHADACLSFASIHSDNSANQMLMRLRFGLTG